MILKLMGILGFATYGYLGLEAGVLLQQVDVVEEVSDVADEDHEAVADVDKDGVQQRRLLERLPVVLTPVLRLALKYLEINRVNLTT